MKKYLLVYAAGVVTAPVWLVVFRKPISRVLVPIMADEDMDASLYNFMRARIDYQDCKEFTS